MYTLGQQEKRAHVPHALLQAKIVGGRRALNLIQSEAGERIVCAAVS